MIKKYLAAFTLIFGTISLPFCRGFPLQKALNILSIAFPLRSALGLENVAVSSLKIKNAWAITPLNKSSFMT
jgi:hypothetical protein